MRNLHPGPANAAARRWPATARSSAVSSGDPRYQPTEDLIAAMPPVSVPAVVLESGADGVLGGSAALDRGQFTGYYEYALLPGTGHNVPQEAPREFANAVLSLARRAAAS